MSTETKIIPADRHCVSCRHWNGVRCDVTWKRKNGTGQCSRKKISYETHPAFLAKKKSFEN